MNELEYFDQTSYITWILVVQELMIIWVVSEGPFFCTIIFFVQTMEENVSSCVVITVTVIEFGV